MHYCRHLLGRATDWIDGQLGGSTADIGQLQYRIDMGGKLG